MVISPIMTIVQTKFTWIRPSPIQLRKTLRKIIMGIYPFYALRDIPNSWFLDIYKLALVIFWLLGIQAIFFMNSNATVISIPNSWCHQLHGKKNLTRKKQMWWHGSSMFLLLVGGKLLGPFESLGSNVFVIVAIIDHHMISIFIPDVPRCSNSFYKPR